MRDRYLQHVTLSTGHTRRSYREEVTDEALAAVSALLARALAGERVPLPVLDPPCVLLAESRGQALLATIAVAESAARLVTLGVAARSTAGAGLWRQLHQHATEPVKTDPRRPPPEPWVAARIEPGVATLPPERVPDLMMQLADLERVIAWAFLARTEAH